MKEKQKYARDLGNIFQLVALFILPIIVLNHYYIEALRASNVYISYSDNRTVPILLVGTLLTALSLYGAKYMIIPWWYVTNEKGEKFDIKRDLHSVPKFNSYMLEGPKARIVGICLAALFFTWVVSTGIEVWTVISNYYF